MWLKFEKNARNTDTILINLDCIANICQTTYGGGLVFSSNINTVKINCIDSKSRNAVMDIIADMISGTINEQIHEFKEY